MSVLGEQPSTYGAWLGPGWGSGLPALIVASALTGCVARGKLHNLSDSVPHLKVGAVVIPAGIREDQVAQPLGRCRTWCPHLPVVLLLSWPLGSPLQPRPLAHPPRTRALSCLLPSPAADGASHKTPRRSRRGCSPGAWPALPTKACRLPAARALRLLLRAWTLDSVPPPSRNQKLLCSALSAQTTLPQRWT